MKHLSGVIIPAVTPFDRDGSLRLDWLQRNLVQWNRTRINGVMVLGSNGEFRSLDDNEALEVIKTAAGAISNEKALIVGIGRESLYQTLAFLNRVEDSALNIDYVSVLTPCYFKKAMTDQALISYYTHVADQSPYPVLLYSAPGFANSVCISPEALKILAAHPNIAGIKDTSGDMMPAYMESVGARDDFSVIAGSLSNVMVCLERGGRAGVLSAANYLPEACAELFLIMETAGPEKAIAYYEQLKSLAAQTGGRAGIAGVKAAMELMGYRGGSPRLPVLPCDADTVKEIHHYMNSSSLLSLEHNRPFPT